MIPSWASPDDDVFVCPHWNSTCRDMDPEHSRYFDHREPPLCHNRHVMDVKVRLRDWRVGVGWPRRP